MAVGVVGVIYLVVSLLGFFVPTLFGIIPHGYTMADNLIHLVLGIVSLLVSYSARGTAART
jgi:putative effector of murein hydrolase LrgA (UPF0299 family)